MCSWLRSENVLTDMINKKLCVFFCFRARGSEIPRSKSINNGKPIQREHFRPSAASLQARPPPHRASSLRQIPLPALALVRLISKSRWVPIVNQVQSQYTSAVSCIPRLDPMRRITRNIFFFSPMLSCKTLSYKLHNGNRRYFPSKDQ